VSRRNEKYWNIGCVVLIILAVLLALLWLWYAFSVGDWDPGH
jgi:hypothetical protein